MKNILVIFLILIFPFVLLSQENEVIEISFNKTVHLFFHSNIEYTDVGSPHVLISHTNNILKLAAKKENFEETNLTVMTKEGRVYSYILKYKKDISKLNYFIGDSTGVQIPMVNIAEENTQPVP